MLMSIRKFLLIITLWFKITNQLFKPIAYVHNALLCKKLQALRKQMPRNMRIIMQAIAALFKMAAIQPRVMDEGQLLFT